MKSEHEQNVGSRPDGLTRKSIESDPIDPSDTANEQALKQAALLGETAVEMGVLGSRLLHTRLEVTGGNYVELFTGNDHNHGTLFNTDGSQRNDSATSDKFGQGMIEVFVRDAFKSDAIVPMWDIKTIAAQDAVRGAHKQGLEAVYKLDIFGRTTTVLDGYNVPYAMWDIKLGKRRVANDEMGRMAA
jgi:hypothetical protein